MQQLDGIHHTPVMLRQVVSNLNVCPGGKYVDCTLGDGGHTSEILAKSSPAGAVLGIDADPEAIQQTMNRLHNYGDRIVAVNANFGSVASLAHKNGFIPVDGILFDLGLSSRQLDLEDRGFSFRRSAPLDMRFGITGTTASELVNDLSEQNLANLIYEFGEERKSRRIARAIVNSRPIEDALQLAEIVAKASGYKKGRTHPATRTFQALRIVTNNEIENLRSGLDQAVSILKTGGRLVTIAYHSLEDREIKKFFAHQNLQPLSKKVLKPEPEEISNNRRSRSARMRVAERV
jgi:16S rRNA (cytosine1402-N4)-methyltransferase